MVDQVSYRWLRCRQPRRSWRCLRRKPPCPAPRVATSPTVRETRCHVPR